MINIFYADTDTIVIDKLTLKEFNQINNFVYHGAFKSFYQNSYIRPAEPGKEVYGKSCYQIVAQGSRDQLKMLKVLAENLPEKVSTIEEPSDPKVMPAPKKVTVDEFVEAVTQRKTRKMDMSNCPFPWDK